MQLKGQEHFTYRGTMIQIMPSFLLDTMETKHKRTYISMEKKQKQKNLSKQHYISSKNIP